MTFYKNENLQKRQAVVLTRQLGLLTRLLYLFKVITSKNYFAKILDKWIFVRYNTCRSDN